MFAPNFKIPGAVVAEKSDKISLCITLEWEIRKGKKKDKINFCIMVFFYTINFNPLQMYTKFETGSHSSWEICDEKFYLKEKWTNKGTI